MIGSNKTSGRANILHLALHSSAGLKEGNTTGRMKFSLYALTSLDRAIKKTSLKVGVGPRPG